MHSRSIFTIWTVLQGAGPFKTTVQTMWYDTVDKPIRPGELRRGKEGNDARKTLFHVERPADGADPAGGLVRSGGCGRNCIRRGRQRLRRVWRPQHRVPVRQHRLFEWQSLFFLRCGGQYAFFQAAVRRRVRGAWGDRLRNADGRSHGNGLSCVQLFSAGVEGAVVPAQSLYRPVVFSAERSREN